MDNVRHLPAMRLAAVQHRGPYNQIGPAFHTLGEIAGRAGLFGRATGPMMGVYKDDPTSTRAEDLRSAAGIPVPDDVALPEGLVEERLETGTFFCVSHRGPYTELPHAWAAARDAFLASGRKRRAAPSYELYVNTPGEVADADLVTDICIPVD